MRPQAAESNGLSAGSRLEYDVVDVFTDRAFAGNPLAVVYGADRLSTAQLQAITSEFNLSETAFPATLTELDLTVGADYRVRIFTPGGEVPFAGHPTLGTAWSLRQRSWLAAGNRKQACGAGLIGVRVPADPKGPVELSALPRDSARTLSSSDGQQLAELVGVASDDIIADAYAAGCGLTWLYLRASGDAVTRSRASGQRLSEATIDLAFLEDPVDGVNVYAVESSEDRIDVHSRVYVPGYGISEDPATGSAAAGLGLVLVASGVAEADGETAYTISQGVEMGRPSRLHCRVEANAGVATLVHVAGQVVPVASGTIVVPAP